eukprot:158253-Pelagomonas_calceolata.AAC.2
MKSATQARTCKEAAKRVACLQGQAIMAQLKGTQAAALGHGLLTAYKGHGVSAGASLMESLRQMCSSTVRRQTLPYMHRGLMAEILRTKLPKVLAQERVTLPCYRQKAQLPISSSQEGQHGTSAHAWAHAWAIMAQQISKQPLLGLCSLWRAVVPGVYACAVWTPALTDSPAAMSNAPLVSSLLSPSPGVIVRLQKQAQLLGQSGCVLGSTPAQRGLKYEAHVRSMCVCKQSDENIKLAMDSKCLTGRTGKRVEITELLTFLGSQRELFKVGKMENREVFPDSQVWSNLSVPSHQIPGLARKDHTIKSTSQPDIYT